MQVCCNANSTSCTYAMRYGSVGCSTSKLEHSEMDSTGKERTGYDADSRRSHAERSACWAAGRDKWSSGAEIARVAMDVAVVVRCSGVLPSDVQQEASAWKTRTTTTVSRSVAQRCVLVATEFFVFSRFRE